MITNTVDILTFSKKKKKKKLKDLEEPGDVDNLREGELPGQTANKEGEKEKRKSFTSLLKRLVPSVSLGFRNFYNLLINISLLSSGTFYLVI